MNFLVTQQVQFNDVSKKTTTNLIEIDLHTGRHHQIRAQLAAAGCPVKGDLKYGSKRSNEGGGISLHARKVSFIHPVKKTEVAVEAPLPDDKTWRLFRNV